VVKIQSSSSFVLLGVALLLQAYNVSTSSAEEKPPGNAKNIIDPALVQSLSGHYAALRKAIEVGMGSPVYEGDLRKD
jgi:hypothetical protein